MLKIERFSHLLALGNTGHRRAPKGSRGVPNGGKGYQMVTSSNIIKAPRWEKTTDLVVHGPLVNHKQAHRFSRSNMDSSCMPKLSFTNLKHNYMYMKINTVNTGTMYA